MLVQELPEGAARVLEPLLDELELPELAQVVPLGRSELLQQLLAVLQKPSELLPDRLTLGALVDLAHLLGEGPLDRSPHISDLPTLVRDLHLLEAHLPEPALALVGQGQRGCLAPQHAALVRQAVALLHQHLAEGLTETGHLELLPGALEILLELGDPGLGRLAQGVDLLRLAGQGGQGRPGMGVGLGEPADRGVLRLRGLLRAGGLLHCDGRGDPPALVDQLVEPADCVLGGAGLPGRLVPLGVQELQPHGVARQLLLEAHHLRAARGETGLLEHLAGVGGSRRFPGRHRSPVLLTQRLERPPGLGQLLADCPRAPLLLLQLFLEAREARLHTREVHLLPRQPLLELRERRIGPHPRGQRRLLRRRRLRQRVPDGAGLPGGAFHRRPIGAGKRLALLDRFELRQGLAVELRESCPLRVVEPGLALDFLDPGLDLLRGERRGLRSPSPGRVQQAEKKGQKD